MKLVSIDLQSEFGFFRKPDTNNTINLSYNIIHKPAVLGILGAILGLDGYKEKGVLPAYYTRLKNLKIGIEPLNHDRGNFAKTSIRYSNTIGYANKGANFLTEELTLISPAYRIYILLDEQDDLHTQLLQQLATAQATYIPYFGKNEFTAWWERGSFKEYNFHLANENRGESVEIKSIFEKVYTLKDEQEVAYPDFLEFDNQVQTFIYFERLPLSINEVLMQYQLSDFVYSTYKIKKTEQLKDLYYLNERKGYVQFL
ncbi:type I-B CRISPR-associated protein Cas5b [Sphingobacterium sp. Mn56C]|uniref:type I-B CRISPR-associated protein Cas5b n=1 Tax=Sphingobacterium sp. Mn56C TaxID=3395261 RepID=UPI003BDF1205